MRKVLIFLSIFIILGVVILGDGLSPILSLAKQCEVNNVYTRQLVDLFDGQIWATAVYLPLPDTASKDLKAFGVRNPAGILVITSNSTRAAEIPMVFTIKDIEFTIVDNSNNLQTSNGECFYADYDSTPTIVIPDSYKDLTVVSYKRSVILYVWANSQVFGIKVDVNTKAYSFSFSTSSSNALWNIVKSNKEYSKFLSLSK